MQARRLVLAAISLVMTVTPDARADDLPLSELNITISVPSQGGFSHQVISGLDVVVAAPPFDGVVMSFGIARNVHGEPCAFASGLDGPGQPIERPPGWQYGAHFEKDGLDTNVFCVDVAGGQLNAITVRASTGNPSDDHLKEPYAAVFAAVRGSFTEDDAAPAPAPVEPVAPVEPAPPAPAPVEPAPPTPAPAQDKPTPRHRLALGYRAYEGTFYDFAYGREIAPWASSDGKTPITLSGLRFVENRGLAVNMVLMILSLGGAAGRPMSPVTIDASGRAWVNREAEIKAHDEYNKKVIDGASQQPFSFEISGYHDSMGSDMNGFAASLRLTGTTLPDRVSQYGVDGGHLASNRNYVPATADAPMSFSRSWFGITYDYHRLLWQNQTIVTGVHGRALVAIGDPWIVLINLGPEVAITDRLHIAAYVSQDIARFDFTNGMGWRGELGVRF
jgi:hypothetical protein